MIEQYVSAARRVVDLEPVWLAVEMAGGNLLHACLDQPGTGGDGPAVAAELPVRVVVALAEIAPILVVLCAEDRSGQAMCPSDGIRHASALTRAGACAILVTGGARHLALLQRPVRPPGPLVEGTHARLSSWLRQRVTVPVGCLGGLRSRVAIDSYLAAGAMDFAVLERPFVREPALGLRFATDPRAVSCCSSEMDCTAAWVRGRGGRWCRG